MESFVIFDIDDTHLLVNNSQKVQDSLKTWIEAWQDENSYAGEDEFLEMDMEDE